MTAEARLPFTDFEYRIQASDGRIAWYSVSGEPMFDEHGAYQGYRGTGKDITERKLAEEALRQSRARIRELAAHQETIKETERQRIARDLHDELGQTLLAIRLDATTLTEQTTAAHPDFHRSARLIGLLRKLHLVAHRRRVALVCLDRKVQAQRHLARAVGPAKARQVAIG
ncbi:histidine kinase [Noviherbaspirillum sedimenti]|uniref:histidine kinase n=1 Tax=Noviherbaspirillum sedimenti TaxID=2320865 RepID=UPI002368F035|nr:histidine kinase [Noviherbaspirillum sedimenti]